MLNVRKLVVKAMASLFGLSIFLGVPVALANPIFSSLGAVSDNTTISLAKAADTISFTLTLNVTEDSDGSGLITFDIGALTAQTANFPVSGSSLTHTATYVVPAGATGGLSVTNLTFTNTSADAIVSLPAFSVAPSPNVTVDTTAPGISAVTQLSTNADVSLAATGDTVTYSVTYNENATVSAVNTASGSTNATGAVTEVSANNSTSDSLVVTVQFGDNGIITPTVDFDITDKAGNTVTVSSLGSVIGGSVANTITADTLSPTLNPVTIASDNTDITLAKSGDQITLSFTASETLNTLVGSILGETTINNNTALNNWDLALITSGNEPNVLAGFTINFTDLAGNSGTQVTAVTDVSSVTFDSIAPVITFTDTVSSAAVTSDNIEITVTDADLILMTLEYGYSADAICNSSDVFGNIFVSGASFAVASEATNGQYICVMVKDSSGNESFNISTNTLNIDITAPLISSVTQLGSNANASFAKAGDSVTYSISYNENSTVSAVNTASSAVNATGLITEVSAAGSLSDTLVVTVQVGDNGIIAPTVDFDLTDSLGNTRTISSLGTITGGSVADTITADTMLPTLTTVGVSSNNTNTDWAKSGDRITVDFVSNETINSVISTIIGRNGNETNTSSNNWRARLTTNGTDVEGVVPFIINFSDLAGNAGLAVSTTTDLSVVTFDRTVPSASLVTISSNNALDSTLAKTNDVITVSFTVNDNLSPNLFTDSSPTILSQLGSFSLTTIPATNAATLSRMTDGSETSEVVVPFSFSFTDSAGNQTAVSSITGGSNVQFDRTDPVVSAVKITATSQDGSAYTGDVPTYYAKQGDTLDFSFEVCDFVDSQNNPPVGDVFSSVAVTMTDAGLTGATCTTPIGNTTNIRKWSTQLINIDGVEGLVTFDVDVFDNTGNAFLNLSTTTNGSSVIFDKSVPLAPTDAVDLAGLATARFKPTTDAVYSWNNDTDLITVTPFSGINNYVVRFFNPNTGINETATVNSRSFVPTNVIPDNAPYELYLQGRDKAGNLAIESLIYAQAYGPTITGIATDKNTGEVLSGVRVNAIAEFGQECDIGQKICGDQTDQNGRYSILVQPNQIYILDFIQTPRYGIAKDRVVVATLNVIVNAALAPVAEGLVQTGNQGTIITLDQAFEINGKPQTTYVTVFSNSGSIKTTKTEAGVIISSFGEIQSVTSNNPDLVIVNRGDNTFLVSTPVKILNVSDATNTGSSVSSTFVSGANAVGTRRASGGANSGFQAGIKREDLVKNNKVWTQEESMAFADRLNQGTKSKTLQYRNSNGYMVFGGYQSGRLAMKDMTGNDSQLLVTKQIVYRGPRRGTDGSDHKGAIKAQRKAVESLFKQDKIPTPKFAIEEGNQQKIAVEKVETKKIKSTAGSRKVAGLGRAESVYSAVLNKRDNDARYVNKFERKPMQTERKPSRIASKNVKGLTFRTGSRGGGKLTLGQVMGNEKRLVTQRERVVQR